jgi:hypothetical protein
MLVQETYIDKSHGCIYGETEPYEPYTDDVGRLFRDFQREYGRCTSKVYIDRKDGSTASVGWVFVKRAKYQDCTDTYLQETWVTLYKSYEKKTVVDAEYHTLH